MVHGASMIQRAQACEHTVSRGCLRQHAVERGCCAPLHPCQSLRLLTCIGEEIFPGQEEQKTFPTSHH